MKGFFILLFAILMIALGRLCCGAKESVQTGAPDLHSRSANFG